MGEYYISLRCIFKNIEKFQKFNYNIKHFVGAIQ